VNFFQRAKVLASWPASSKPMVRNCCCIAGCLTISTTASPFLLDVFRQRRWPVVPRSGRLPTGARHHYPFDRLRLGLVHDLRKRLDDHVDRTSIGSLSAVTCVGTARAPCRCRPPSSAIAPTAGEARDYVGRKSRPTFLSTNCKV
jgi:hypothetical protein